MPAKSCRNIPKARHASPNQVVCPKGKPGESDLTPQNQRVYDHFRNCRATGTFPDDGLVQMHAAILEPIFSRAERDRQTMNMATEMARLLLRLKR